MSTLLQEHKTLIRFFILCLLGYIGWFLMYTLWIEPFTSLDFWLSSLEAAEVTSILSTLGFDIQLILEEGYKHAFYLHGQRTIGLANSCNGLVLFPLFSLFIIATPGLWKFKILYLLVGCVLIYHVNIMRIIALIFIKSTHPESLNFNHKYTFTIIVYSFIFFLWHIWITYFSKSNPKENA